MTHPDRTRLILLSGAAFAVRLAFVAAVVDLGAEPYQEFGQIAEHLRAGHGFAFETVPGYGPVPSAWMPPGYVALLALLLGIADVVLRNVLLYGLQALVGALCVPLAFAVARAWTPGAPRAAWAAAGLAGGLPTLAYAAATVGPTVFYHAGLLGALLLLARLAERPTARRAVGLGVLFAALVAVRSEAALLVALFLAGEALRGRWRAALVAGAVCAALVAPWVARNAVVLGSPTLSTGGGLNLYRGNNPEAVGTWNGADVGPALAAVPPGPGREVALQRVYTRAALAEVRARPGRALIRSAQKALWLWTWTPSDPRARHPVALGSWALLAGLALLGVATRPPPLAFWLVVTHATLVAAVFFALPRHQVLLAIALVPVAGHGAARLWTAAHTRGRPGRAV